MHPTMHRRLWNLAAFVTVSLGVACGSATSPFDLFQPVVTSATDTFQLKASNYTNISASKSWAWQNTGTRAAVTETMNEADGNAHITIRDASGAVVYSGDFTNTLSDSTTAGVAGSWSVQLTLTHFSGGFDFRAQKL